MVYFYFNECVGEGNTLTVLSNSLEKLIVSFNKLTIENNLVGNYIWVFQNDLDRISISNVPLKEIVDTMSSKEARTLFYAIQRGAPIDSYFKEYPIEELLTANYIFDGQDATNLAIASICSGILLSIPCNESLCKDVITIVAKNDSNNKLTVDNFYGETTNLSYISDIICNRRYNESVGVEKLKSICKQVIMSEEFLVDFDNAPPSYQNWILERFDDAKIGNLLSPMQSNGTIIKHLEDSLFELRIVNPVDIRVYVAEKDNILYIAKMALKSSYKNAHNQHDDIVKSIDIISRLKNK